MASVREVAGRRFGQFAQSPEAVDRGLIIVCAVVWLLVLGVGVGAAVALINLGSGRSGAAPSADGSTPWLLYTVIGVSVLIIAAAVPLLIRARRTELSNSPDGPVARAATALSAQRALSRDLSRGGSARQSPASLLSGTELNRILLRCTVGVITATGAAMVAVALGSYLLATAGDNGSATSWIAFGLAGFITAGMSAIPVRYLKQLRSAVTGA